MTSLINDLCEIVMKRNEVLNLVSDVVAEIRTIRGFERFPENIIVDFGVTKKRTAGLAFRYQNRVSFNPTIMEIMGEKFKEVVLHELAHLMQYHAFPYAKQAHGPEFRRCCALIGASGTTFISDENLTNALPVKRNTVTRYKAHCVCGIHYLTKAKLDKIQINGVKYRCNNCKTHITSGLEYFSAVKVPSNVHYEEVKK
jgi:predicted SprT family Zn-dependent metalloprotease